MAISYVGSSSASNGLATGSTLTLSVPAGVANGDYMLAFVAIRDEAQTITPPAGWVQVAVAVNETDHEFRIYERTASGEPASYNWALGGATAYTGHMRVYRGVGARRAQTETDLLNVLAHTGPSLVGGPGSWRIVTESAQSLLSVGWAPPAGFSATVNTIGGLLILLNVNMMTAHAGPSVGGGTFQETSTSLDLIVAINGLIILEPLLSPMVGTPIDGKGKLASPTMGRTILPTPIDLRVVFVNGTVEMGITGTPLDLKASSGTATLGLSVFDVVPVDGKASVAAATAGFILLPDPIFHPHLHASGTLIPGEVVLAAEPVDGFVHFQEGGLTPGEVIIGGMPLLTSVDVNPATVTPGEVVLYPPVIDMFVHVGASDSSIMLGYLLSPQPIDTAFGFGGATLGLRIGSFGFVPFIIPDPNTIRTVQKFATTGQAVYVSGQPYGGVCCPS